MTTPSRRTPPTFPAVLDWLESGFPFSPRTWGPAPQMRIEDYTEEGAYVLRAEMPGIDPDKDVEIEISGGVLTVSGERREEKKDKGRHELHYGSFSRTVTLPVGAREDDVTASYTDGVLEIRVPLGEQPEPARKVKINT